MVGRKHRKRAKRIGVSRSVALLLLRRRGFSKSDQKVLKAAMRAAQNVIGHAGKPTKASEETRLLRSLNEAMRDIDAGKGVPIDEVRRRVASWAVRPKKSNKR